MPILLNVGVGLDERQRTADSGGGDEFPGENARKYVRRVLPDICLEDLAENEGEKQRHAKRLNDRPKHAEERSSPLRTKIRERQMGQEVARSPYPLKIVHGNVHFISLSTGKGFIFRNAGYDRIASSPVRGSPDAIRQSIPIRRSAKIFVGRGR